MVGLERRRILHVLPADLGRGAQVYADALVRALDGRPDDHTILTIFRGPTVALDGDGLGLRSGRMRRAGFDGRAPFALRRAMRRHRPDVLVAHGGEAMKYVALAWPAAPIAYYKIGTLTMEARSGSRHRFQRWLASRAAVVAAVSSDAADEAVTMLGIHPERVRVIPNGRASDPFARPRREPSPLPTLGFLGAFTPGKRPDRFLDLVRQLRARGVPVTAVMAGDGPQRAAIEPLAHELDIAVLGHVDDVPAMLLGWDVLAFTSLPHGEGMPGVLIEAGLAGVAAVATDVPGANDVILDGTSGAVVPVEDLEAMVQQVEALLRDPDRRQMVGAAARARCEAQFSLAASAAAWQAVVEELRPRSAGDPQGAG